MFNTIVLITGILLLVLGVLSGFALFSRTVKNDSEQQQLGNLWGLFLCGLTLGLLFIWYALL